MIRAQTSRQAGDEDVDEEHGRGGRGQQDVALEVFRDARWVVVVVVLRKPTTAGPI